MNRTNRNEESSLVGKAAPMSANSRYGNVTAATHSGSGLCQLMGNTCKVKSAKCEGGT